MAASHVVDCERRPPWLIIERRPPFLLTKLIVRGGHHGWSWEAATVISSNFLKIHYTKWHKIWLTLLYTLPYQRRVVAASSNNFSGTGCMSLTFFILKHLTYIHTSLVRVGADIDMCQMDGLVKNDPLPSSAVSYCKLGNLWHHPLGDSGVSIFQLYHLFCPHEHSQMDSTSSLAILPLNDCSHRTRGTPLLFWGLIL